MFGARRELWRILTLTSVFVGCLLLGLMYLCFDSTSPATLPVLFPTDVRSGASSVAYNFSVSLFGGTTPLISTALVHATHNLLAPAFYLVLFGLVGVVAVRFMPETAGQPLPTAPPVAIDVQEAHELVREPQEAVETDY